MTKNKILTATAALAATTLVAIAPASAAPGDGVIKKRLAKQVHRIERGVRNGELTRGEFRKLKQQNRRIRKAYRRAKFDDGRLDRFERRKLQNMLDRASRNIHRKKHNFRTQYNKGPGYGAYRGKRVLKHKNKRFGGFKISISKYF